MGPCGSRFFGGHLASSRPWAAPTADLTAVHSVLEEAFAGGSVDYLVVLAPYRGRGIGAALLSRSFASFAARGLRRVMVNVDAENPTGATAVYERVGMRVVNRWDLWEHSSGTSRGPSSLSKHYSVN